MSLNVNKLNAIKVIDPIIDINDKPNVSVFCSGVQVTYKEVFTDSYSNSSSTINAPPPSPNVFVDRKIKLKQPITIEFTGTSVNGNNLLQSQYDAFRSFPLYSIMESIKLQLNNLSVSINPSDWIGALSRYNLNEDIGEHEMSKAPRLVDQSQRYSELNGGVRNPLGYYGDSNHGAFSSRGGFPYRSFTNTPTSATIEADLTSSLLISPLIFGMKGNECGFIGLQTFQLIISWSTNLARIWSHNASSPNNITSITVTLGRPSLLFKYVTPSPLLMIPSYTSYNYIDIQRYPTTLGSFSPDSFQRVSSRNIQLNTIPRRVYIYIRKRNQDLTYNDADAFFSISNIDVQFENSNSLLTTASQQDLYDISVKNGCMDSWTSWSAQNNYLMVGDTNTRINGAGSVMCIDFGRDIGLSDSSAPDKLGTFQLLITLNAQNKNQVETITPELYIVVVNEGVFTLENNIAMASIGVLSAEDIQNAKMSSSNVNYDCVVNMVGTSFFGKLNRGLKYLAKKLRKHLPAAKEIIEDIVPGSKIPLDVLKEALKVSKKFGYGYPQKSLTRKKMIARHKRAKSTRGSALVGGKMLSKAQLKKLLK